MHKVLYESSEHFWWVWGLILNMTLPLLPSFWGFSFALGCGVYFFGGIQHSPVNGSSAVSFNLGVLAGEDEPTSLYSIILKPFNITVIQVYAPTSDAEEAEVERFYEDLQDLLELTPRKRCLFHCRGLECKK